ncbi:GMC family oxidoreductase [Streptomyces aurantiogriseus]|uniref:Dehydrogenase n=1 Tax=Streptomyces aurantiogriseus TaxID=66870 RepID=A0A918FJU1_9ACTN|nr:GMC family oxidoreductase [Streptomyces aurantiogriseus]GGR44838.1 dehydrogenase [Streptomyces aurantiogriseus]
MSNEHFDLVIVGGGIAAATVAKTVVEKAAAEYPARHPRILILEAGRATAMSADKYDTYVEAYQEALIKVPNSPYPASSSAPQPDVLDIRRPVMEGRQTKTPADQGYFVQMGPLPFGSDYARSLGGTTLHWLGTCLRMLPHDFRMYSTYRRGVDWPLTYEELKPYYERAEWDIIGVAANVDDQYYPGFVDHPAEFFKAADTVRFPGGGYSFPMERIPSSYLDQYLAKLADGMTISLTGRDGTVHDFTVRISNTPSARNSTPTTPTYEVVGAVGNADRGQRCEGNSSCIPICPAQAKYSALKTLYELIVRYPDREPVQGEQVRARVAVRSQSVVMEVLHTQKPGETGTVTGLRYKTYYDDGNPPTEHRVTAGTYVLAANAIENATLLLASGAANNSDQVGRNLMDHPLLLTWGLLQENVGAFRGPGSTSGIPVFRDGPFRKERTAFRVEIGNWGWNFPENAPYDTVHDLVGGGRDGRARLYGKDLRRRLGEILPRQFRIAWELEQDPQSTNRVTVDDRYRDALGKHRPVLHYDLSEYVRASLPWAAEASKQLFRRLGIDETQRRPVYEPGDYTHYDPHDASAVEYDGMTYWVRGAGHVVGTHRMGDDPRSSVVDSHQHSHDLDNLYIVGCGSMPTLGTSNPTLTMTALAIRTGDRIAQDLKGAGR